MMTAENYCYWLRGFFEMTDSEHLTKAQVEMIKDHLTLVFNNVLSRDDALKTFANVPTNVSC